MRDIPTAVAQIMKEEGHDYVESEGRFYPNCQGIGTLLALQERLVERLEHRCRVELVMEAGSNQGHYRITKPHLNLGEDVG